MTGTLVLKILLRKTYPKSTSCTTCLCSSFQNVLDTGVFMNRKANNVSFRLTYKREKSDLVVRAGETLLKAW